MSATATLTTDALLDVALRRCLLGHPAWQQPGPPLDPGLGESCRDLELTASRTFLLADLEAIVNDEVRLHALTHWALYALLSKPHIIQFTSRQVRWRSGALPAVRVIAKRDDRIEVIWSWLVQFCAPEDTDNVYLTRMAPAIAQLTLF